MLAITTIYFNSYENPTFPEGFQFDHLLLETWDAGSRPIPVYLYRTLGCTHLLWILTIMWA